MKTYTRAQALEYFADEIRAGNIDIDNYGQLMAYSGLYEWPGGEFRDQEYVQDPDLYYVPSEG